MSSRKVSRRRLLGGSVAAAAAGAATRMSTAVGSPGAAHAAMDHPDHTAMMTRGEVDLSEFDPSRFLYDFDYGEVEQLADGRTKRSWQILALDKEIEVAPGVFFPAWTYNGQVPGPTLRCTEGDLLHVRFINGSSHPHTIHFHGFHPAEMDGVFEIVPPGGSYSYEFEAEPMGLHLYHCHAVPLKRHIHKGLYGAFIIDPKTPRPEARELVMVMNGFDTNFDGDNEVYAVNTVAFHYQKNPIVVEQGELVRIYLVNALEFDLVNSFHVHGHMFDLYRTGTRLEPDEVTDTVMMCQGERHILEMRFKFPGRFMFHAHQSEFAELGWMGLFDVRPA